LIKNRQSGSHADMHNFCEEKPYLYLYHILLVEQMAWCWKGKWLLIYLRTLAMIAMHLHRQPRNRRHRREGLATMAAWPHHIKPRKTALRESLRPWMDT
jgi:hypothetical protein